MYDALIVDGGMLWRAAYAAKSAGGSAGERFLEGLLLACRFNAARGVRVCWEGGRRGRQAIYPAYKVGKGSDNAPEDVREDFARGKAGLVRLLPLLGVDGYVFPDWEADDGCATLARRLSAAGLKVLVMSADKDLFQLVRRRVHILRPRRDGERPDVAYTGNFLELSGVAPGADPRRAWLSYQSLRGDPTDGIPGVPGLGEKRAREAVAAYPDVLERLGRGLPFPDVPPAVRRALEAPGALEAAALSYQLALLRDDLEEDGRAYPAAPNRAHAEDLLDRLGWADGAGAAPLDLLLPDGG